MLFLALVGNLLMLAYLCRYAFVHVSVFVGYLVSGVSSLCLLEVGTTRHVWYRLQPHKRENLFHNFILKKMMIYNNRIDYRSPKRSKNLNG